MARNELISANTQDLTKETNNRSILSYVAYSYYILGGTSSVLNTEINAIAKRHELFLISLVCLITAPVVFGIFSKINSDRLESLEEEINLRKGQLRFWDRRGNPRVLLKENS